MCINLWKCHKAGFRVSRQYRPFITRLCYDLLKDGANWVNCSESVENRQNYLCGPQFVCVCFLIEFLFACSNLSCLFGINRMLPVKNQQSNTLVTRILAKPQPLDIINIKKKATSSVDFDIVRCDSVLASCLKYHDDILNSIFLTSLVVFSLCAYFMIIGPKL